MNEMWLNWVRTRVCGGRGCLSSLSRLRRRLGLSKLPNNARMVRVSLLGSSGAP